MTADHESVATKVLLIELEQMRNHSRENGEGALALAQALGLLVITSVVSLAAAGQLSSTKNIYELFPIADVLLLLLTLGAFAAVSARLGAMNWADLRAVRIEQLLGVETIITTDERTNHRRKDLSPGWPFPLHNDKEDELLYRGLSFLHIRVVMLVGMCTVMLASLGMLSSLGLAPHLIQLTEFPPPLSYWAAVFIGTGAAFLSLALFRALVRNRIESLPEELKQVARDLAWEPPRQQTLDSAGKMG